MSKPAIVLVPGACLSTTVFSSFLPYLQKLGYSTLTLQLASANPQGDPHLASAVSDAADLRKDIVSILESDGGRDIIVVLHSYAGIPGGGAVKGLSKSIRAEEGKKGGIVGVVWLAALLLPEGKDVASWLEGGKGWEGNKINFPRPGLTSLSLDHVPAGLFNELDPSSPLIAEAEASYVPHAISALSSTAPPQCWQDDEFKGMIGYVQATMDQVIPFEAQERMVKRSEVDWVVRKMEAGHLPWVAYPSETAKVLIDVAKNF